MQLKSRVNLSKNFKNSVWNILEVLLAPLLFFISIPLFIDFLGPKEYGLWMFVNSVVVFMQALNLGLPTSTYKHVSTGIEKQSEKAITQTLNTNISLTLLLVVVCFIICLLLNLGIYFFDWFVDSHSDKSTLIFGLLVGMGVLGVKYLEQIFYNCFRAYEEFQYATIISIGVKFFTVLGNLIIAYYFRNILFLLLFTLLVGMIGIVLSYLATYKLTKFYSFSFDLKLKAVSKEVQFALITWFQSIAIIAIFQGDKFIVSYHFGMFAFSFYVTIALLFNHIHMAFAAITPWLFPQVAKNKENKKKIRALYVNVRNASIVISTVLLAGFCLVSKFILTWWLGEFMYGNIIETVKWFCVFEFFFLLSITPNFYLNASGKERFNLKLVLFYTSLNAIGLILGVIFGTQVWHLVLGLATSTAVGMFFVHYFVNKRIEIYSFGNVIALFIPALLGSGVAVADSYPMKGLFFIACLVSLYLLFFKFGNTNIKRLFGDEARN